MNQPSLNPDRTVDPLGEGATCADADEEGPLDALVEQIPRTQTSQELRFRF